LSLFPSIIKAHSFKKSKDNRIKIHAIFCPICKNITNNRTKRFDNTRAVFYHLHEFHREDPKLKFALKILDHISNAIEMEMLHWNLIDAVKISQIMK